MTVNVNEYLTSISDVLIGFMSGKKVKVIDDVV